MSKNNKHQTRSLHSISFDYLENELKLTKRCPKKSCKGLCVEVLTQYKDHGPINYEYECTSCGKVIKDIRFFNKQQNYNKKNKK